MQPRPMADTANGPSGRVGSVIPARYPARDALPRATTPDGSAKLPLSRRSVEWHSALLRRDRSHSRPTCAGGRPLCESGGQTECEAVMMRNVDLRRGNRGWSRRMLGASLIAATLVSPLSAQVAD